MKIKTSELTGIALDWAVAKCENSDTSIEHFIAMHSHYAYVHDTFDYSTDWAQGGPLIQRERMEVMPCMDGITWEVRRFISECELFVAYGSTPLIAAMRCFCCSELGDVVDIPKEFSN